MLNKKPFIILDRDGVINYDSDNYIRTPDEWLPIPGSLEAIALLHQAGYRIVVATNQSGVARGLYDEKTLEAIHEKMHRAVIHQGGKIEKIFYCPHAPQDACDCRKPKPGLLKQIEKHFDISLNNVPYVGDSLRDLQAAQTVSAKPILVRTGYGETTLINEKNNLKNILVFSNLLEVAHYLLKEKTNDER